MTDTESVSKDYGQQLKQNKNRTIKNDLATDTERNFLIIWLNNHT